MESKRKITAKLINLKDNDGSFDLEFWQQAGVEARFAAAWQMVVDMMLIRGENGDKLRFQRSVENVERLQR